MDPCVQRPPVSERRGCTQNAHHMTRVICTLPLHPPRVITSPFDRRTLVRRAGMGMFSGILALSAGTVTLATAATVLAAGADPQALVHSGMAKFEVGDVEGSLRDFDAALIARPSIRPYLWQRGLSLYYLNQFSQGATQFREDVAVNPNDTEEAIWAFLCESKIIGTEEARRNFLKVGRDSRPVMRAAEEAFRMGSRPEGIREAAGGDAQGHAAFYSLLYTALWHEAHGNEEEAKVSMLQATDTTYARQSGDYMTSLARVHCTQRGWAREVTL